MLLERAVEERQEIRSVSWSARFERFQALVTRYLSASCRVQLRSLLDAPGAWNWAAPMDPWRV
ncbi:MAG: hypothetical protein WBY44_13230 [Bryobacteraceae bacterium]